MGNRGFKMKTTIMIFALILAVGAFIGYPPADVSGQAAAEPMPLLAMMQAPQGLPTEAYDAI